MRIQAVDRTRPSAHLLGDEALLALLLDRVGDDLGDERGRDDDHAVGVADEDVAGLHRRAAAGDRARRCPRARGGGRAPPGGGRRGRSGMSSAADRGAVAHAAVGDDARGAVHLGAQREDVADRAGARSPRGPR